MEGEMRRELEVHLQPVEDAGGFVRISLEEMESYYNLCQRCHWLHRLDLGGASSDGNDRHREPARPWCPLPHTPTDGSSTLHFHPTGRRDGRA
ncbi:hypothetical protein AAFF_G00432770 [Aldrovandia affinis]|uniref:Uncharacterized protein n=1 Tax=Aldrovandia affinis TaxID=143900 RepID=A0AAD7S8I8_9TELE|nr:hypothetical protein AAFF_G00432770 [Aldrovandia affinis]